MSYLDLNTTPAVELQQHLTHHQTLVACLCATWCDVCCAYRVKFEALAQQHPELLFLWIDVEDHAELVGDFDVENFPTLLIQHHGVVTFYGVMQPDVAQLARLIKSQIGYTHNPVQHNATEQQRLWQRDVNLIKRLQAYTKTD